MASQVTDKSTVCSTVGAVNNRENMKALHNCPLWAESTSHPWIPFTKAEGIPMTLCCHVLGAYFCVMKSLGHGRDKSWFIVRKPFPCSDVFMTYLYQTSGWSNPRWPPSSRQGELTQGVQSRWGCLQHPLAAFRLGTSACPLVRRQRELKVNTTKPKRNGRRFADIFQI